MGTINQLYIRFKSLNFELIKQLSLRETVSEVPELNRAQLKAGKRSDDKLIRPQLASRIYALDKQRLGGTAPFLTPDLLNTGAFQKDITTIITTKTIKTFSLDLKAPALELKYSPFIYGLSKENTIKYALGSVLPILSAKLKAATVG